MSARSFRALWMLEEAQLPYELRILPFPPRALHKPYLGANPLGTVPLLIDGATRMTESAAICQYLASRNVGSTLDVAPCDPAYGAYLNFLHYGEATLTFPQTLVLRYAHFELPERRQPQVVEDYRRWFLARLRALEPLLIASHYVCAERFTAADVSVGYALLLAQHLGLDAKFTPALTSYWTRLQRRDAYQRALAAQTNEAIAQGVSTTPAPDLR